MDKPFHLMTPAERTALRIAQNRAISEKVEEQKRAEERDRPAGSPKSPRKSAVASSTLKVPQQPPPKSSTPEFLRATPEERAQRGSFIRKVQS